MCVTYTGLGQRQCPGQLKVDGLGVSIIFSLVVPVEGSVVRNTFLLSYKTIRRAILYQRIPDIKQNYGGEPFCFQI